jgi:hypothetical protein
MGLPEYRLRNQREAALWYCLTSHKKIATYNQQDKASNHQYQSMVESDSVAKIRDSIEGQSTKNKDNSAEMRKRDKFDWIAVFTCLLVIVAAFQVLIYIATERAVVTIASVQFKGTINPVVGQPLIAVIDVKNSGRSTAFVTKARFYSRLVYRRPFPTRPEYPEFARVTNSSINGPLVVDSMAPLRGAAGAP